jgi:hypothetical protein
MYIHHIHIYTHVHILPRSKREVRKFCLLPVLGDIDIPQRSIHQESTSRLDTSSIGPDCVEELARESRMEQQQHGRNHIKERHTQRTAHLTSKIWDNIMSICIGIIRQPSLIKS